MLRSVISRSSLARVAVLQPSRSFAYTPVAFKTPVVDTAKEILSKANKKTGEVLASAMETAENATPSVDDVKYAAEKVNKKTGEVLADGLEAVGSAAEKAKHSAEEVTQKAKEGAEDVAEKAKNTSAEDLKDAAADAAHKVNKKTGEALSEGMDKAEDLKDAAKSKGQDAAAHVEAKYKVEKNAAGYKDLQDKGRKVESEQNRPDDAV